MAGLRAFAAVAPDLPRAPRVDVPEPSAIRLPQTCLPRGAYFAAVEDVAAGTVVGRVAAEMLTPYPPGIPVVLPGERITAPVLDYLRYGVAAGMNIPDAADPELRTVRVVADS